MKYGLLFSIASLLMVLSAATHGGWSWLVLWPAMSFGLVAVGYLWLGPSMFGKRTDGTLSTVNVVLLLPFLLYVWSVWHILRRVKRESAYNELLPGILIGRRLLAHELPDEVTHVVDLTSEFPEPSAIRRLDGYRCFATLDATGVSRQILREIISFINDADGTVLIHCAEGHGRTGLIAAGLLLERGVAVEPDQAIAVTRECRPRVRLNNTQFHALQQFADELNESIKNGPTPSGSRAEIQS